MSGILFRVIVWALWIAGFAAILQHWHLPFWGALCIVLLDAVEEGLLHAGGRGDGR